MNSKNYKSIIALFFALTLVGNVLPVLAQVQDSLDIAQIVQQQIEEAKKKSSTAVLHSQKSSIVELPVKNAIIKTRDIIGIPEDYFYKGLVMLVGSLAIGVWYFLRRLKSQKTLVSNSFKNNIKLMREEKFIKEIDPRLKNIRTKLTLTSVILNEDQHISAAAKKSRIGKEEIILASRMRAREMQYGNKGSFA